LRGGQVSPGTGSDSVSPRKIVRAASGLD
jgi:hypothetical protein